MHYPNLEKLRISHSSVSSFRSCARKLEFRKFYPASFADRSVAGDVGNALHAGYQDYLINRYEDGAIAAMMRKYPIDLNPSATDDRSLEACYATLMEMIRAPAMLSYELATIEDVNGVKRPAVEVAFQINLVGVSALSDRHVPVEYIGYIDAILFDRMTGEYIVVDIKTTRQRLNDLTASYKHSDQCVPYAIVLERALGHSIDGFTVRYMSVFVDIENPKVSLYSFPKSMHDVRDWARGLLVNATQMRTFADMGWFPRNGNSCMAFNRPCSNFDICDARDPEVITALLLNNKTPVKQSDDLFEPWIVLDLELAA